MYGLKQVARLAWDLLIKRLKLHGSSPNKITPNVWSHESRRTKFILCVDDIGVKYYSKQYADHLLQALQQHYAVTIDWEGKNYCELPLEWNYINEYITISMPNYVIKALQKLQHTFPKKNNLLHIFGTNQIMVERPSLHRHLTYRLNLTKKENEMFNILLAPSYTTEEQLIQLFFQPSMIPQISKHDQLTKPTLPLKYSLITCPPIRMQKSATIKAICNYMQILMLPI